MEKLYFEEKLFELQDYSENLLPAGNYENCQFVNCNFSNSNISNVNFTECEFNGCNLSMAILAKTAFRDIRFIGCKLLGLHFEHCNEIGFTVYFDNCILNLSSFYKLKFKKTTFKNCSLIEVDFAETDLSASQFYNCDLAGATFDNTILEKADFSTSFNYSINPEINRIKKAKFSIPGIIGLLEQYDIEIV